MLGRRRMAVGSSARRNSDFPDDSGKPRTITLDGWVRIAAIDWAADSRNLWVRCFRSFRRPDSPEGGSARQGHSHVARRAAGNGLGNSVNRTGQRIAIWQASGSANVWSLQGF